MAVHFPFYSALPVNVRRIAFASVTTLLLVFGIFLDGQTFSQEPLSGQEPVSFNRQIRPILADICFNCHGPDEASNVGGVRLDRRIYAVGEGDSGEPTIVPGSSKTSELVRRIVDVDDPMPPVHFQKQLSEEQKELLKRWIDEGAQYEGHWAFSAPVRGEVPAADDRGWTRNGVDAFVLKKLQAAGLQPAPEASRRTLIRRLALDLNGLPPTKAEINNFLSDVSPDAYEKLVDYYLSQDAFGERMARPWLDHARYADSNGFQSDGSRDIWAWREWVINAYNQNMSFDKFTVDQLAGDMLPNPETEQIIATGFNRNHRLNGEGGRIVDEWFVETVIDRVETTGLTWMGLTFNCCRCHDHKYDPISQKEFYQMFAFFNSVEESGVLAPAGKNGENTPPLFSIKTPEHEAKLATFDLQISEKEAEKNTSLIDEAQQVDDWLATLNEPNKDAMWHEPNQVAITCQEGATFERQSDGSFLAQGKSPDNPVYEIQFPVKGGRLSGILIEAFADDSLPRKFLGRSPSNGNFVLTDVVCEVKDLETGETTPVRFVTAKADFEQPNWTADKVLVKEKLSQTNRSEKGWATLGFDTSLGQPNRIMLLSERPVEVGQKAMVNIRLYHRSIYAKHAIGRLRIKLTEDDPNTVALQPQSLPPNVLAAAKVPAAARAAVQQDVLTKYYRENVSTKYRALQRDIEQLKQAKSELLGRVPTTMVMKEGKRRDAFLLLRGEYDKPGIRVERALPDFLPPMPAGQPMNRLGLARWIVHESNPLTARVWVNRTWQRLFGTGIVKSTENFGTQADYPSHPQLLDWLAVEFRDPQSLPRVNGQPAQAWDMKAFIKLLVTSSTYRQSSNIDQRAKALDPENRLLSRGPRFRLDGETIRDQALAASGLLVQKVGGPSVRPYMPEGVWDETSVYGNLRNYKADSGEGLYRRTIYTIWKRTAAPPTMLLFDAPNRETCTIARSRTNTPLQALSLLNENTFVESAQSLARRMVSEGGATPAAKVEFAFEVLTARQPSERELALLLNGYREDLSRFLAEPSAARAFLNSVNEQYPQATSDVELCELAALSLTANVLLNLDEVVTRQ